MSQRMICKCQDVLTAPGVLRNVSQEGKLRKEPVRAEFLVGEGLVLGGVHDVAFEYVITRFRNASLIPSLLAWLWHLVLVCKLVYVQD